MKTILITLSILQTLNATANETQKTTWSEGPFWKGPQILEVSKKLELVDSELKLNCENFKKIITAYSSADSSDESYRSFLAQQIDRVRNLAMANPMQNTFKARFAILDTTPSSNIEVSLDLSKEVTETMKNEKLPMYTQANTITGAFIRDAKNFELVAKDDSYSSFSRRLGLGDSQIKLSLNHNGQYIIETYGRDIACDLLNKKITLKAKIPSYVSLTKEGSRAMSELYIQKLAPAISNVLANKNESIISKSARLGYRMGKILEEVNLNNESELNEKHLENLIKTFFIPNSITPSSLLSTINGETIINYTSSISGQPLTLTLGM
jgi:hypothetical protein